MNCPMCGHENVSLKCPACGELLPVPFKRLRSHTAWLGLIAFGLLTVTVLLLVAIGIIIIGQSPGAR